MSNGYNAKMAFINSLQSEKISENLNVILQNTEAQDDFWNLCKSYAEIGLNAPKYRTPGTCDVQGVFQYADIDTAKDNTVEFIQKYNIDDVDEFFDLVEKILCMGLNDVVVSASPGGILVSDKKDLSVQVHPTDEYAQENENGQLGKTEMWYVLDAGREAKLVYGLKQNCTKAEMRRAIADGTVMKYLQKVPIHKDDLFFIQAGTVHAIGAGALVAEIQENSNLKKSKQRSAKVQKNI